MIAKTLRTLLLALAGLAALVQGQEKSEAATSGPYPAEIAAWGVETKEEQREAGRRMIERITADVAAGKKTITIPKGDYRFAEASGGGAPTHILLPVGMEGVTLDFQGSTLWFETSNTGMVLARTKDCTIRNVFLDWDPLPFMQGTVEALQPEEGTFDIRLYPGYERTCEKLLEETWRGRGITFDRATRELKTGQEGCEVTFSWKNKNPDGSYRLKFHGFYGVPLAKSGIEVGDPYVVLRRLGRAVRMEGDSGTTLENVTLYSAPFIAYVKVNGISPTFRRCNILKRPGTNRLMAGNADGINCANTERGPVIEGCRMETIGDDFVNVHGALSRVIWQEKEDEVVVTRVNGRGSMGTPVHVEFFDRTTMRSIGKRMATWTFKDWMVEKERCLADLEHRWHSGDAARLAEGSTVPASIIKLDKPLKMPKDAILVCESLTGPGTIIRDCDFKGSLARGLRLQAPDVLVENSRITITCGPAITMGGQPIYWGEGPYVYNATVKGNTFVRNSISGSRDAQRCVIHIQDGSNYAETRLQHDISIMDNVFTGASGPAIIARGVDNLRVTGNLVEGYGTMAPYAVSKGKPEPKGMGAAIVIDSIKGLVLEGNQISDPGSFANGEPVVRIDTEP